MLFQRILVHRRGQAPRGAKKKADNSGAVWYPARMAQGDYCSYLDRFPNVSLLCMGDLMLDIFVYGKSTRLSPEAPVPVMLCQKERSMPGGAGNMIANLRSLDCAVHFIGAVGDDSSADSLHENMAALGVDDSQMLRLQGYPTPVKTRYVAGQHHLLRVDREQPMELTDEQVETLLDRAEQCLPEVDMVLLSDYGKGLFDERLTPALISLCNKYGKRVIVDPKRTDYTIYAGAYLVKPNLKEFQGVTGRSFDPAAPGFAQEALEAGREVCRRYGVGGLLVTLSEHGMIYIPGAEGEKTQWIPTEARDVFDVSGAGDTSLATLGAMLAAGASVREAMRIANAASGIVVGKFGTACVKREELARALSPTRANGGIVSAEEAAALCETLRAQGKVVGFTNGCFDLLHPGHLQSFERARALCDVLIVGLNTDASIRRLKGPDRPVNGEASRAALLAALKTVDYVVLFDDDTALPLIEKLRPDVIAKEGYPIEKWPEGQLVESYGGRAVELPRLEGFSSTSIINKLQH